MLYPLHTATLVTSTVCASHFVLQLNPLACAGRVIPLIAMFAADRKQQPDNSRMTPLLHEITVPV
jgi:hypothetical protein